jgi:hypothetical protein
MRGVCFRYVSISLPRKKIIVNPKLLGLSLLCSSPRATVIALPLTNRMAPIFPIHAPPRPWITRRQQFRCPQSAGAPSRQSTLFLPPPVNHALSPSPSRSFSRQARRGDGERRKYARPYDLLRKP